MTSAVWSSGLLLFFIEKAAKTDCFDEAACEGAFGYGNYSQSIRLLYGESTL